MRIVIACLMTMLTSAQAHAASAGPEGEPSGPWREQFHWVPVRDAIGIGHLLYTRICRPHTEAPARVVLINHGAPPDSNVRPTMQPAKCESEAVQWFLTRGYLVVLGMRRGYGETGGQYVEDAGRFCPAEGYAQGGRESARDVDALVNYATALPYARPDGAVIVGQSAGGWAAIAYDGMPHPKVLALVSMAGGRGAHQHMLPNNNCRPDELARAAGMFGATASTPMLWVYAANDTYFAPDIAVAMYTAFSKAGGKAEFVQAGAFGNEGHFLFNNRGGSAIWGPMMERYLASRGAGP
jgi:pimeloyl-ACP methyl ester carboxylesterase